MEIQVSRYAGGYPDWPVGGWGRVWADGLDGQEDELDDVRKGELDAPTDDEGPGSIDDVNKGGRGLESEDEDDALIKHIEERGQASADEGGKPAGKSDGEESMEDLAREAGVKLPE